MKVFILCLLGVQAALAVQQRSWEPSSYRGQESSKDSHSEAEYSGGYQGGSSQAEYHGSSSAHASQEPSSHSAASPQSGGYPEAPNVQYAQPHQPQFQGPQGANYAVHPNHHQQGYGPQGVPRGFPVPRGFMGPMPPHMFPGFQRGFPGPIPPGFVAHPFPNSPRDNPNFPHQQGYAGRSPDQYATMQPPRFPRPFQPPFPPQHVMKIMGHPGFLPPGPFPGRPPFMVPGRPPMMMQVPPQFMMKHSARQEPKEQPREERQTRTQSEPSGQAPMYQDAKGGRYQHGRYPPQFASAESQYQ